MLNQIRTTLGYLFNFRKNLRDTWGQLITFIIPLALSIPKSQSFIAGNGYCLTATVIIFLVGYFHSTGKQANSKELENQIGKISEEKDRLQYDLESIPERIIKSLFDYFNFAYTERITVYRFDDSHFVPVGRYAKNTDYKKSGRKLYPKSEGFIALAWRNGDYFIDELPDHNRAKQRYINTVKAQCNIDENIINQMQMKSRAYYCKNLDNSDGEPVAVIVFESMRSQLPKTVEEISTILNGSIGNLLTSVIKVNLQKERGGQND